MNHHQHHENAPDSGDSTPPMAVSQNTRITAPVYAIIAVTIAIAGSVMAYSNLLSTDKKNDDAITGLVIQVSKHEERLFKLEQAQVRIDVMQNDISWIRQSIEGRSNMMPKTVTNPGGK